MTSALRTFVVGGVLGVGIVSGGALAFAQTSGTTAPSAEAPGTTTAPPGTDAPTTAAPSTAPGTTAPPTTGGTAPEGKAPGGTAPDAPGKAGRDGKGGRGGHGQRGGRLLGRLGAGEQQLATELGVTVDQLKDAQKAAAQAVMDLGRPTKPATRPPSDENKAKLEAELKARVDLFNTTMADKLGISTDRLRDARVAVVAKHLDEAVANGKLTREQADKILAAVRDGSLDGLKGLGHLGDHLGGGFGHGGHGGHPGKGGPGAGEGDGEGTTGS
jgi:hypothetical protein